MKRMIWGALVVALMVPAPASAVEKLACGAKLDGFLDACGTPKARFKSCACRDEKHCHEQALIGAENVAIEEERKASEPLLTCLGKELKETYEGKRLPGAVSGCAAIDAATKAARSKLEAATAAKLAFGNAHDHYKECQ